MPSQDGSTRMTVFSILRALGASSSVLSKTVLKVLFISSSFTLDVIYVIIINMHGGCFKDGTRATLKT